MNWTMFRRTVAAYRIRFLACAVGFFWYLFLPSLPLTPDIHRWYIGTSMAVLALVAASILWSLRTTRAGNRL